MKKTHIMLLILVMSSLCSCTVVEELLTPPPPSSSSQQHSESSKASDTAISSPHKKPQVLCTYFHYFNSETYEQWWWPSQDPKKVVGPEPWRRDLWIGRAGDYPYIGMYDNVRDAEIIRWHIRLAQAAGIDAFMVFMNDWEQEAPQTTLLLDIAAEEGFKIGLMEHHSYLGAASRSVLDGHVYPIPPRKYLGYGQITDEYAQELALPHFSGHNRYIRPVPRSLRDVPRDALDQAVQRISGMLNRWKPHPAILRINGKPVVSVPYMDSNLTAREFNSLVTRVEKNVGEDVYIIAIVPFVYWYFAPDAIFGTGMTEEWARSGAEAFTHWTPNGMITASQKLKNKAMEFNVKDSKKWKKDSMIPIMPGFEDDTWRPGDEPAPTAPRNNGQAWRDQLDAALKARPQFLFIQSWNEWHEGAQIEPSTLYSDPYLYLKILAQKLGRPWQTPPLPPESSIDPLRLPYLPY